MDWANHGNSSSALPPNRNVPGWPVYAFPKQSHPKLSPTLPLSTHCQSRHWRIVGIVFLLSSCKVFKMGKKSRIRGRSRVVGILALLLFVLICFSFKVRCRAVLLQYHVDGLEALTLLLRVSSLTSSSPRPMKLQPERGESP
jgi:hypothetical protein